MKKLLLKIREVFLPIVLVSVLAILIYDVLRWTLNIKLGLNLFAEDLVNIWFPLVFPWVFILIFLRKRIRILKIAGRRDNGHFFFQMFVAALMALPIINSQKTLIKSSYPLIEINSIAEIFENKKEKFFKIDDILLQLDRKSKSLYHTAYVSGKNNQTLKESPNLYSSSMNYWRFFRFSSIIV